MKGIRVYKRNRMVVTNSVVSRKDPTFNTITYDWAPPGLTQKLVREGDVQHHHIRLGGRETFNTITYNLQYLVKWHLMDPG